MTYQQPQTGYFRCDICGKQIERGRSLMIAYPAVMREIGIIPPPSLAPLTVEAGPIYHFHTSCLPALKP